MVRTDWVFMSFLPCLTSRRFRLVEGRKERSVQHGHVLILWVSSLAVVLCITPCLLLLLCQVCICIHISLTFPSCRCRKADGQDGILWIVILDLEPIRDISRWLSLRAVITGTERNIGIAWNYVSGGSWRDWIDMKGWKTGSWSLLIKNGKAGIGD